MDTDDPTIVTPIGKTYAEVDAEQADYVSSANEALESLRNLGARWWYYMVSHYTLEILIGEATGKNNLVIALSACEWITGPVEWPNQNLRVLWHNNRSSGGGWDFIVQDLDVGFEVRAGTFMWARDYDLYNNQSLYSPHRRPT